VIHAADLTGEAFHHEREDVSTLKHLVAMLPECPVVVNIGAAFGTSALSLLEARPDLFVFSVDVKPCEAERRHLAQSTVDPARCVRILGRSQDIGQHWPRRVDMAFVDGSHARKDVIADLDVWLPRIKPGGIVALDDYEKGCTPAVKPVVDEFLMGKYELVLHVGDIVAFRV
jgi:predicted O-methyltransferase YrrM